MIKKHKPVLVTLLILLSLTLICIPAFCASDNPVTDFTESVKNSLNNRETTGQSYLVPFLAVTAVLLLLIIFLIKNHVKSIKNKSVIWNIDLEEKDDGPDKQRRAWFRLPVNQYFMYAQDKGDLYERTRAINISGGGLLFATDEKPGFKEKLKIYLNVAPGKRLIINGQVAWVSENPDETEDSRFLVGVEFIDIKAGERDSIVRKILEKQQRIIVENKRKANHECVKCGIPLTEEDRGESGSLCPRCRAPAVKITG